MVFFPPKNWIQQEHSGGSRSIERWASLSVHLEWLILSVSLTFQYNFGQKLSALAFSSLKNIWKSSILYSVFTVKSLGLCLTQCKMWGLFFWLKASTCWHCLGHSQTFHASYLYPEFESTLFPFLNVFKIICYCITSRAQKSEAC